MPCNCAEKPLDVTKPSESHKKKCGPSVCHSNCCPEEQEVDCCTPAFLRLEKLRNGWTNILTDSLELPTVGDASDADGSFNIVGVNDRHGDPIPGPTDNLFSNDDQGECGDENGIALVSSTDSSGNFTIELDLAYYAYLFTNTLRYTHEQECGKKDQLVGWLFDTSDENLEIFQDLPALNLTTNVNRETLINKKADDLTRQQKKQLYSLNILYKLSLKALAKAVSPRGEGNIVQVSDKTGQEWLVAINAADSEVECHNTKYVIVAVPLC